MSFFIHQLQKFSINTPKTIIETGTYKGDGIISYLSTNYFDKIYSIELSNKFYLLNKELFKDYSNVILLEGYSHLVINDLVNNNILENEPILFYLDAHFSGGETAGEQFENGCPVLKELNTIAQRNVKGDIIFIDDMRLMGKAMWGGTDGCTTYPKTFFDFTHASYENIINSLNNRSIKLIYMCDNIDRLLIILD